MKKILNTLFFLLILCSFVSCSDDSNTIKFEKLPYFAKSFIEYYFPDSESDKIEIIHSACSDDEPYYMVFLNNNITISFTKDGAWRSIDGNGEQLPQIKFVLNEIYEYISDNHPDDIILKISKSHYGTKIELSNNLLLGFYANESKFAGYERENTDSEILPNGVNAIVLKYFPEETYQTIFFTDLENPQYDIWLTNFTHLLFKENGDWYLIGATNGNPLPDEVVNDLLPQNIKDQWYKLHPDNSIKEIEKHSDSNKYTVQGIKGHSLIWD